jgi:hypothetical protein
MSRVDHHHVVSPEGLPRQSLLKFTPTPPRPPHRRFPVLSENPPPQDIIFEPQKFLLPTISFISQPIVSCETVANLLSGKFTGIKDYIIVDCRYDYEHEGGHLPHAISVNHHDRLRQFHQTLSQSYSPSVVIIFHCEFSQNRAPKAFHVFRSLDRAANVYPNLSFPQMYIMEGGYRQFYSNFKHLCMPSNYVTMADPELSKRWRKEVNACKKSWIIRRKEEEGEESPLKVTPAPLRRFIF